jgi:hypothetical protein
MPPALVAGVGVLLFLVEGSPQVREERDDGQLRAAVGGGMRLEVDDLLRASRVAVRGGGGAARVRARRQARTASWCRKGDVKRVSFSRRCESAALGRLNRNALSHATASWSRLETSFAFFGFFLAGAASAGHMATRCARSAAWRRRSAARRARSASCGGRSATRRGRSATACEVAVRRQRGRSATSPSRTAT